MSNGGDDIWGIDEGNNYPVLSQFGYVQACPDNVQVANSSGADGSYFSLADAFLAINSAGSQAGNSIDVILKINQSLGNTLIVPTGDWDLIRIYPNTEGLSLSSTIDGPLVHFDGTDNVIVDGRVNASGTDKDLIIENLSTGSNASTIRFSNGAQNNTVQYAIIRGSSGGSASGVIHFSGSSNGANSGNVIANNDITNANENRPVNAIYSSGDANPNSNTNTTISSNNIFNFINPNVTSSGIRILSNSSDWIIEENSLYDTQALEINSNVNQHLIWINSPSGVGFQINNNFLGGNQPFAAGAWATTSTLALGVNQQLQIFYINVGSTAPSEVQGNVITGFNWSGVRYHGSARAFYALRIEGGQVKVGTTSSNFIGSGTEGISITATGSGRSTRFDFFAIDVSNADIELANNIISNLKLSVGTTEIRNVHGIRINSGTALAYNNIISIASEVTATLYGILDNSMSARSFIFNTIYLSGNPISGTNSSFAYFNNSESGTKIIQNNIFENRKSSNGNHYAVRLAGLGNTTIDYNNYRSVGASGGFIGQIGSTNYIDFPAWQSATGQDANSLSIDPQFANAGGTEPANYETAASLPGIAVAGIETDFFGNNRNPNSPQMGALEEDFNPTPVGSIIITNGASSPAADWILFQGKLIPLQNNPSVNVDVIRDFLINNGDLIIEAPVVVTLNATLSTELSSARTLTLRSGRDIIQGQSISIASSGAPLNLVFWSDVDGNGGGSIWIRRDASINTNGGHLWMGGGSGTETWNELSVGNGFAQARTVIPSNEILQLSAQNDTHQDGVIIERSSIVTGNGDVYIKGRVSGLTSVESSGYGQIGVYTLRGSAITTTNGNITIFGITESTKTSSSWFWGVLLGSDRATEPNRIETTSGSIYIEGNASQTENQNHSGGFGIFEWANLTRGINEIKTHSGDIILRGHNKNTTTNSYGGLVGLNGEINSKRFISQSGNITLHGISDDPTKNGINISSGFRVGYDGTHPYSGNITIQSNRINALPSGTTIRSTGNLQIIPHDNHTTIGIAGAPGTLALPVSYFSTYFDAGFSNIVIGSENQSGSIAVNGFNLAHHMTMQTSSTLTLGGKPVLGAYNLTLGKDITNIAGSPTHYFQTNSTGQVVREIPTAEQGFFPVGNAHYNPATITNKTGSSDQFSVRVMDDVLLEGLTGPSISTPHVKVTWDIDKQQANDETGIDFEFQWGLDQENGGISEFRLNHHNGSNWEFAQGTSQTTIAGSRKTMVHTGYTGSFSPFALGDPNAVLPVTLMSFEANCSDEDVLLQWTTASEFNNDFFMVYGSSDAINWTALERIAGNGTTNVPQRYQTELAGSNYQYYRLLQQDYDGANEWLPIVRVDCDQARTINANPNPFDSRIIFSGLDANASYNLKVYRENGQLVQSYVQLNGNTIETMNWTTGMYLIILESDKGEVSTFKLIRR